MSNQNDFDDFEDEAEPVALPWYRQRRFQLIIGASLVIVAFLAISQSHRAPVTEVKNGQNYIGAIEPYTAPEAKPAPPAPAAPKVLPPFLPPPLRQMIPPTMRPAMTSYKLETKDPPAAAGPAFPDQTGLKLATAKIPGAKASPAIDETLMLMPGLLPCVLDTAIASDLPGPFMCHLPGPVYSARGVLLMDAGTQVIGQYKTMKNNGGARLEAVQTYAWTPNGVMVPLVGQPTADDLGRTGLDGNVDYHYWQRFAGAVLLDLTQSALGIIQANVSKGGNTYISTNSSDQLASEVLQASINMPPTFTRPQGTTMALWITEPISFADSYRIRASQ